MIFHYLSDYKRIKLIACIYKYTRIYLHIHKMKAYVFSAMIGLHYKSGRAQLLNIFDSSGSWAMGH